MTSLQRRLRGVLAFSVTPFHEDLSVDYEALERHIAWMANYGFCGLVVAAGAGEIYSLTVAEAVGVVEKAVHAAAGRLPVFGGVGFNAAIAAEMARGMERTGAAGLLVMPPYYSHAPEEGLLRYYEAIGSSCELPLMGYSRDWAIFSPAMVARLAERVPTLQFWKDGQGNPRGLQQIMAKVGDRLAWLGGVGDDCAGAYFAVGVQGYTSGISNLAPKLCLALGEAGLRRDIDHLNTLLQRHVHPFYAIRGRLRGYEVAVTKAAMRILDRPAGSVRPPLKDVSPGESEEIRRVLETWSSFLG